jgi:ribosomal protein S8
MDQIANMLIALKNGGLVKKTTVTVPSSKVKVAILELLKKDLSEKYELETADNLDESKGYDVLLIIGKK